MFRSFMKTRLAVVGLAAVSALALAAGAYAYFTSTGTSAPSSATAGSASNYNVTISPAGTVNANVQLFPTLTTDANFLNVYQPYSGVVTNTSAGRQQVTTLTANITGVTPATGNSCGATTNFMLFSPGGVWTVAAGGQSATTTGSTGSGTGTTTLPDDLAAGGSLSYNTIGVYLLDTGHNQDGCQGATVNVTVTAS